MRHRTPIPPVSYDGTSLDSPDTQKLRAGLRLADAHQFVLVLQRLTLYAALTLAMEVAS